VQIEHVDFNHAENYFKREFKAEWGDIVSALTTMPLHLKASDQRKIKGKLSGEPAGFCSPGSVAKRSRVLSLLRLYRHKQYKQVVFDGIFSSVQCRYGQEENRKAGERVGQAEGVLPASPPDAGAGSDL
jgi:hypothetical protein